MTRQEQLYENYEDAYFALLMDGVAEQEGERLERINRNLLADPAAALPEALDQRCLRAIDRHFVRRRRRTVLRQTLHYAAILALTAVILFTTAFATSKEFRIDVLNLYLRVTQKYTEFRMVGSANGTAAQGQTGQEGFAYFENIDIGWIPEGFHYNEGRYDTYVDFENDVGEWFSVNRSTGTISVDTENPESIEEVCINGNEGLCIVKNGYIHIITADLVHALYLDVYGADTLSIDTVKKIVENICVY